MRNYKRKMEASMMRNRQYYRASVPVKIRVILLQGF